MSSPSVLLCSPSINQPPTPTTRLFEGGRGCPRLPFLFRFHSIFSSHFFSPFHVLGFYLQKNDGAQKWSSLKFIYSCFSRSPFSLHTPFLVSLFFLIFVISINFFNLLDGVFFQVNNGG